MAGESDTHTLTHPSGDFSLEVPVEWHITHLFPSETPPDSPPEVDFGFAVDARRSAPEDWIGLWFNRLPPQALRLPQLMFLAHPLPALSFEAFAERMREKLARMGGEELRSRDDLTLGGHPAGEYAYALGPRRIRIRLTWHGGRRLAVFFAGDERAQLIASRGFERLASGVRLVPDRSPQT